PRAPLAASQTPPARLDMAPPPLPPEVVADGRRGHAASPRDGTGYPIPVSGPQYSLALDGDRMNQTPAGTRGEPDARERARPVRRAGRGDGPSERRHRAPARPLHDWVDGERPPAQQRLRAAVHHQREPDL